MWCLVSCVRECVTHVTYSVWSIVRGHLQCGTIYIYMMFVPWCCPMDICYTTGLMPTPASNYRTKDMPHFRRGGNLLPTGMAPGRTFTWIDDAYYRAAVDLRPKIRAWWFPWHYADTRRNGGGPNHRTSQVAQSLYSTLCTWCTLLIINTNYNLFYNTQTLNMNSNRSNKDKVRETNLT